MDMRKIMFCLVVLAVMSSVLPVRSETFAKKKVVEPVVVDSLTICLHAGDSCMQQFNTFEALKYYQQAYTMADTLQTRTKLANCHLL